MIGREVIHLLLAMQAEVSQVSLDRIQPPPGVHHISGDLTDFKFCQDITTDVDVVFHVAGIKGSIEVTQKKPASFFVPLLQMNTNVLEACRLNQVDKVVYTSSIGAYPSAEVFKEPAQADPGQEPPPMDMFPGWAKRMAEMQIQAYLIQYGLSNFAVVRPCNVYGPADNFDPQNAMVIPTLMAKIANGDDPVLIWGDGSAVRDFAFSRDVAEGIIQAAFFGTNGGYVNLGSGAGYSVKELVETLHQVVPFNYEFDTSKPSGFPRRVMDISKAREMIGYDPKTSLRDGLEETWHWFQRNPSEYQKRKNYFRS